MLTYKNDIGMINSVAFTYFFSEILKKEDYVVAEWSATNEYINNMARQTNEPV